MINVIKAEHLKLKHTLGALLPVIAPFTVMLLALLLTGGIEKAFPTGAWNWWYTMFLPGMLAIISYLCIKKDKKTRYYHILLLPLSLEKSWKGKVGYCILGLIFSNFIIFLGTQVGGAVFGTNISLWSGIAAALLLSISYLWEIPLFLFLSARFGMFASIFASMALSIIGTVTLPDSNYWWVYPPSIPIRLMCPVLGILPNGIPMSIDSQLYNTNVIVPGICLSLIWFFVISLYTTIWFKKKREA
jgi:ABC-2 type transport system permease protein